MPRFALFVAEYINVFTVSRSPRSSSWRWHRPMSSGCSRRRTWWSSSSSGCAQRSRASARPATRRTPLPRTRARRARRFVTTPTAVSSTLMSAAGRRSFQLIAMSWSTRTRGNVARTQMIRRPSGRSWRAARRDRAVAARSTHQGRASAVRSDTVKTFTYSATKKSANRMLEYSMLKPRDELGLGFGHVEGGAVELGEHADEEQDEGERLRDDVPHGRLRLDDALRASSTRRASRCRPSTGSSAPRSSPAAPRRGNRR